MELGVHIGWSYFFWVNKTTTQRVWIRRERKKWKENVLHSWLHFCSLIFPFFLSLTPSPTFLRGTSEAGWIKHFQGEALSLKCHCGPFRVAFDLCSGWKWGHNLFHTYTHSEDAYVQLHTSSRGIDTRTENKQTTRCAFHKRAEYTRANIHKVQIHSDPLLGWKFILSLDDLFLDFK